MIYWQRWDRARQEILSLEAPQRVQIAMRSAGFKSACTDKHPRGTVIPARWHGTAKIQAPPCYTDSGWSWKRSPVGREPTCCAASEKSPTILPVIMCVRGAFDIEQHEDMVSMMVSFIRLVAFGRPPPSSDDWPSGRPQECFRSGHPV